MAFSNAPEPEEEPFLDSADSLPIQAKKVNGLLVLRGSWGIISIFVLTLFSLIALASLVLGIKPQLAHESVEESSQSSPPSPQHVYIDPHIPAEPQLRDASEFILSPGWDVNAAPAIREFNWTIATATLNPDGIYRLMILINNQYPGPLVECNEGDRLIVHVNNQSPNATSIHFHGMLQNGTNFMDGTVGVTQCPIAPGSSFTYEFEVKGQSGTYWYHAHHSAQASDGLLGPVVVHSKEERKLQELDYATDRVLMIQDHYHNLTSELLMEYLAPDQENEEPVPDNALINGRGFRDCADFPGWPCDNSHSAVPSLDLEAGQRHRLRIINVGAFAEFSVEFDEHPFYVTEVDGTDVQPEPFHRLNILPAQRYSIILETNSTTATDFWMRTRMATHCFRKENEYLQPELKAAIHYLKSGPEVSDQEPTSQAWSDAIEVICRDLNTSSLHPVDARRPPPADDFVALRANFQIGDWRLSRGFFNDSSWHGNATHPSLHRFLGASKEAVKPQKLFEIESTVFDLKRELVMQSSGIRTVDISINNFDDGAHPFHLHGHQFFVLLQGKGGYPPPQAELPQYLESRGLLDNPLRRDTVTVEGFGWAVIRVVFDNPGIWAFHCHNTWHAESGMFMQMLVQPEVVRGWEVGREMEEMCSRPGVDTGMRPDDSIWFGQF